MANRNQASFAKRQKEAAKRAKAAEKQAKRALRRSGVTASAEADPAEEPVPQVDEG